jgi:hypothetical protein
LRLFLQVERYLIRLGSAKGTQLVIHQG